MHGKELRKSIEDALFRLGYTVSYEPLDDGKGGPYRLRSEFKVIIDSRIPTDEKVGILIETLRGLDTSGIYLPPALRDLLGDDDRETG